MTKSPRKASAVGWNHQKMCGAPNRGLRVVTLQLDVFVSYRYQGVSGIRLGVLDRPVLWLTSRSRTRPLRFSEKDENKKLGSYGSHSEGGFLGHENTEAGGCFSFDLGVGARSWAMTPIVLVVSEVPRVEGTALGETTKAKK
ncbi:hypothetical protein RUM43_011986 [Polyplax serrata]|uniref:Uncharacterized protein n=1 Tax=Polyplax serrata TaxID=468196 RepID=A0AAN8Q3K2_POLSC